MFSITAKPTPACLPTYSYLNTHIDFEHIITHFVLWWYLKEFIVVSRTRFHNMCDPC